jgi:hypothetical protein
LELDLPHEFISEEELFGYDWLKSLMDRKSDASERLEETESDAL